MRGDVDAGDRGAARAAVRLEHVAVEPERPLAERLEVGDGAHRAADQPLDLDRPALLAARARLALRPLAGRGGKERVLGGHPAAPPPESQRGTPSSIDAVQRTWVLPCEISTEPCGCSR